MFSYLTAISRIFVLTHVIVCFELMMLLGALHFMEFIADELVIC